MASGLALALIGLVILSLAADQFVKGAARLAVLLRVSPVVVGAIVVGFGTSAPELVVSGLAAADGRIDIGVGAIIGSNVANISLVLGAASLMAVVPVGVGIVKRDAPASVAAVILFALLIQGDLALWKGVLMYSILAGWLVLLLRGGRTAETDEPVEEGFSDLIGDDELSAGLESLRTVLGLGGVVGSAYLLVDGAERIADALDLSGGFVGYTLVAVGTSAPELVTAVAAARRREAELLVGNLLGSNVFNSLAVGGLISLMGPGDAPDVTLQTLGSAIMVTICVLGWLDMAMGRRVARLDGVVLIVLWIASLIVLWMTSAPMLAG